MVRENTQDCAPTDTQSCTGITVAPRVDRACAHVPGTGLAITSRTPPSVAAGGNPQ
jgi:hypothetical protein